MMNLNWAATAVLLASVLTAQGEETTLSLNTQVASMSSVKGFTPGEAEIDLTNSSGEPLTVRMKLVGKDAGSFRIEMSDPNQPPLVLIKEGATGAWVMEEGDEELKPGGKISYRVRFLPSGKAGRYSAELQIGPKDSGTSVILQGVATDALEGENEAPLERIVHALGIPLDVGGSTLKLGTETPVIGESQTASRFRTVGKEPVKMTPVARYSPPGAYPFGWQAGGAEQVAGTLADSKQHPDAHQRLFPPLAEGGKAVEFEPGDASFSLFVRAGKHVVGTDKAQHPSHLANPTRVYPISVFQGRRVENAFLVGFEEASNGDYQDCVFLMENARIADGD